VLRLGNERGKELEDTDVNFGQMVRAWHNLDKPGAAQGSGPVLGFSKAFLNGR